MDDTAQWILVERDNIQQIIDIKGPYSYEEALNKLKVGQESLGGKLHVPKHCKGWAYRWDYEDCNGTYWEILPIDQDFEYPEYIE